MHVAARTGSDDATTSADDGVADEHDTVGLEIERLAGGSGADMIVASFFAAQVAGGPGDVSLLGVDRSSYGVADVEPDGGPGADRLAAGGGPTTLRGGDGDDTLIGGALGDVLAGGPGADRRHGGGNDDTLDGGRGATGSPEATGATSSPTAPVDRRFTDARRRGRRR